MLFSMTVFLVKLKLWSTKICISNVLFSLLKELHSSVTTEGNRKYLKTRTVRKAPLVCPKPVLNQRAALGSKHRHTGRHGRAPISSLIYSLWVPSWAFPHVDVGYQHKASRKGFCSGELCPETEPHICSTSAGKLQGWKIPSDFIRKNE